MKLLHVVPSVDPRAGGPVETLLQRGLWLRQRGHDCEVLSLDDPRQEFVAAFALPVHAVGPATGHYGYCRQLVPWLRARATGYDGIFVEGLWQYHSLGTWLALRKTGVPYYVAPHGMLDPWFKRRYPLKHLKKWLYWPWAEYRVLRDARAVLFTTDQERLLARKSFWLYKVRERVIAYGTRSPPVDLPRLRSQFLATMPELSGRRVLLFLGRIHPKKGCDMLIRAFARVAATEPGLHLVMAGPDQTGWVKQLRGLAHAVGVEQRISWTGMLNGESKWGAISSAEVFVLPSHQENFGVAVAEALACGVPVLISDKVNICGEVEASGAGLVQPDTLDGTETLLRRWLQLDPKARARMGACASATFTRLFGLEAMADSLLDVVRDGALKHT